MLKPKLSSIVIRNISDLNMIRSAEWNDKDLPFKLLFYVNYRKHRLLFSVIIAKDSTGCIRALPWNNNGKDMRKNLKEKKIDNK